jgi:exopolysaccharide biosynthesis polyprenyl glycosylphosphotransferase
MQLESHRTESSFDPSRVHARANAGRRAILRPIRIALDAVAIALATTLAVVLRFQFNLFEVQESSALTVPSHVVASLIWLSTLLVALASNRLYDEDTLFPGGGESARLLRSVIEAAAGLSLFVFLTQSFYVSRSWFGLTLLLSLTSLIAERRLLRAHLRRRRAKGDLKRASFLVSSDGGSWEEWRDVRNEEFEVLAELNVEGLEAVSALVLADPALKRRLADSALVLRARDFDSDQFWQLVLRAGQLGWSVFVHSPVRSVGRDRLSVRDLAGHTIFKVAPPTLRGARAFQKRALDMLLSLTALILLSPMILIVAAMVGLSSGQPIFYKQERVGLAGRPFTMWKFRTMRIDAEASSGPVWTVENDERRTRSGGFLRRTSLDELPQLLNVLKGDMSLIGPRPERPSFVDEFSAAYPWYQFRHRIRPGITGWAQAQGLRGNTPLDSRTQSDNWYIENWSIWLDLKILGGTIGEIFRGRNAY